MSGTLDKMIRRSVEGGRALRIRLYSLRGAETPYRYVFHHLPKCGGTSARNAFTNWFVVINDYPRDWATGEQTDRFPRPVDTRKLRGYHLLTGHFHLPGSYLEDRYPACFSDPSFRLITFVRDPLELQLSLYHYEKKHRRLPAGVTLEQQLLRRHNYLSERIPCTRANYQEVLDRYFFIGLAEQLQESFDVLARQIGAPLVKLKTLNQARQSHPPLSDGLVAEFREKNALDYLVFAAAKKRAKEGYGLTDLPGIQGQIL